MNIDRTKHANSMRKKAFSVGKVPYRSYSKRMLLASKARPAGSSSYMGTKSTEQFHRTLSSVF
eukprot:1160944-Pelagomonas_calceolata.AAC.1